MSAEHQTKRLRTSSPPSPDDVRNCYLNTLPDDSLRIVLRYLSDRPQHPNWHPYISALSVNAALDVGGALACVASLEIRRIGGDDGIPIDTTLDASILRALVHRLPLHRLVLELDGGLLLPDLLYGCGAELRELVLYPRDTVITGTDVLAISTHCTKLASLAIHGYRFEGTLAPIWRSLGSTLTRIYIDRYYQPSDSDIEMRGLVAVPDMVEHCVNLRRVDVLVFLDPLTDVLLALGSRIRVLTITVGVLLSISRWHEMYRACTNLEAVHLRLRGFEPIIDILSLLRTKLVSLKLPEVDRLVSKGDEFFSNLSACSLLKVVELRLLKSVPEALCRKLFESLKSVTTLTCVVSYPLAKQHEDIIDDIACNLTDLESLVISTSEPLKGEDVNALVDLPHLKSVTLRLRIYKESVAKPAEECVVEIVKRLKYCAQLVQLDIDDIYIKNRSPLIAEAAAMYRRKDFDMFIGGVQYRTW